MNKDIQSETMYGSGGDNGGNTSTSQEEGKDDTLRNMAEMMTPEERVEMLKILQDMQKKDRTSGTLSMEEDPSENSGE